MEIEDDIFFSPLRNQPPESLKAAGWFQEEEWDNDFHLDSTLTPVHAIEETLKRYPDEKNFSIVLSTGAYAPLHEGHLSIMEKAKELIEVRGEVIAGGYLCLDNDEYVVRKLCGMQYPGEFRQNYAEELVLSHSWLMVDPWMIKEISVAVNFTTQIMRTQQYLNRRFPDYSFKIYYAFGGDNSMFAGAFRVVGQGVCVARGDNLEWMWFEPWFNPENVIVCYDSVSQVSSTQLRDHKKTAEALYVIRDDFYESTGLAVSPENNGARNQIIDTIKEFVDLEASVVSVAEQRKFAERYLQNDYISLDAYIHGENRLNLSRVFDMDEEQASTSRHIAREGYPNIYKQIESLKPGDYSLVDDDIATGSTMAFVKKLLPKEVNIINEISLAQIFVQQSIFDIVDLRDFVLGASKCGLAVKLDDGKIARVPYIFPYINLTSRANIAQDSVKEFTKKILLINREIYLSQPTTLTDLDIWIQNFYYSLGFSSSTALNKVVDFLLTQLK